MTTVTREPLPVHPGLHHLPWQAQPSFYDAIEIASADDLGVEVLTSFEVNQMLAADWTHRGFMRRQKFEVEIDPEGPGVEMTWDEWLDWQKHRDPLSENPEEAKRITEERETPKRGPGISRRTPKKAAVKKAVTKKTS